ncbi:pyridoxamine 5'-phosphate oxidase family protein [Flammeovirga sp. SJP92]|uniref:pyridoxamine 5'-phosphate oxidase family protein n=1 Tax=Flammeovirga sp. SJP92 TaxID=1775430 RepID=UPI000788A975|nr:pyridoxamine 5'-phosphate oxidase family protein [Flammeovirga sp. SJP92]KXX67069.1 flavin-nucleotide-binding protein [Flammeovirga sp. SJP92]
MNTEIKECIEKSVLCWLATASSNGEPNVSPKEIFRAYDQDNIIIANIASPSTVRNIKENPKVCVSFIDIFSQKGLQIKGDAVVINHDHSEFHELEPLLLQMTNGKFPFNSITKIKIVRTKQILAPKYFMYPDTTEQQQIESALDTYGVKLKDTEG